MHQDTMDLAKENVNSRWPLGHACMLRKQCIFQLKSCVNVNVSFFRFFPPKLFLTVDIRRYYVVIMHSSECMLIERLCQNYAVPIFIQNFCHILCVKRILILSAFRNQTTSEYMIINRFTIHDVTFAFLQPTSKVMIG